MVSILENRHMNKPTCDKCGDTDAVYVRLIAYYTEEQNAWTIEKFCSEIHCGSCGNEAVDVDEKFLTAEIKT